MNKHLFVIGTAVLLLVVGLSGCDSIVSHPDRDKFIGTWKSTINEFNTYTLEGDGTLYYWGVKGGTWEVKDNNRLEFHYSGSGGSGTVAYEYEFKDSNTLILEPLGTGYSETYKKQ